jgi:hypothetical protein
MIKMQRQVSNWYTILSHCLYIIYRRPLSQCSFTKETRFLSLICRNILKSCIKKKILIQKILIQRLEMFLAMRESWASRAAWNTAVEFKTRFKRNSWSSALSFVMFHVLEQVNMSWLNDLINLWIIFFFIYIIFIHIKRRLIGQHVESFCFAIMQKLRFP